MMYADKPTLALLLAFFASACETAAPTLVSSPPLQELYLNVECCFSDDYLEVYADDRRIFADTVATWPGDGLASSGVITLPEGVYHFRAEMNGETEADSTFATTGMQAIVVRYDTWDYERHEEIPLRLLILPLDYLPGYD